MKVLQSSEPTLQPSLRRGGMQMRACGERKRTETVALRRNAGRCQSDLWKGEPVKRGPLMRTHPLLALCAGCCCCCGALVCAATSRPPCRPPATVSARRNAKADFDRSLNQSVLTMMLIAYAGSSQNTCLPQHAGAGDAEEG